MDFQSTYGRQIGKVGDLGWGKPPAKPRGEKSKLLHLLQNLWQPNMKGL